MFRIVCLVTMLFLSVNSYSQIDTTYLYFNEDWKDCSANTATYIGKVWYSDGLWQRIDSWIKNGQVQMTGSYKDKACKIHHGKFTYYEYNGKVESSSFYNEGKITQREYYHANQKLSAKIYYDSNEKTVKEEGWDEKGKLIPGFVARKQAEFKGGASAWIDYLERKLKTNIPVRNGAPRGRYTVTVSFLIDKEGNISEVRAENNPGYGTAEEAVRVIAKGPKWTPAKLNNMAVIFRQKQNITFVVE